MPFWSGFAAETATAKEYEQEELSTESFLDGEGPLRGSLLLPAGKEKLPWVVLLAEHEDSREALLPTARRLTEKGVGALVVDPRGSGDSGGRGDAGGREVGDVLDLIRTAEEEQFDRLDPDRLGILGYGVHGGATALATAVRAPMKFRSIAVFSGVHDLAAWARKDPSAGSWVDEAMGPDGVPAVRSTRSAIGNVRQTKIHLFWDADLESPLPDMNRDFLRAAEKRVMPNIEGHESRPGGLIRWGAGYPENVPALATAEDFVLGEVISDAPGPKLPVKGRLKVPGFVITPVFTVVPGQGDREVLDLGYAIEPGRLDFDFGQTDRDVRGWIEIDADGFDFPVTILQSDQEIAKFEKPAARIRLEDQRLSGKISFRSST
ncbi:MAG: prolyl oligopeptidase family serine peptidase [Planctomycetota bacterium]